MCLRSDYLFHSYGSDDRSDERNVSIAYHVSFDCSGTLLHLFQLSLHYDYAHTNNFSQIFEGIIDFAQNERWKPTD